MLSAPIAILPTPLRAEGNESVIRVTAVVTDRRGQPLGGLRPADFELFVDGKPQPIESVELNTASAVPRAFALMLDEYHTPAGDSATVRESLLRFVSQHLRPDDLAFVVKPLDTLTNIKPTMDRETLRQAISTFEGRKGDYAPRTLFERNYLAQAPAAVASARGQIVTSALRAIGLALAHTANVRPAIVLVSDGFERMQTGRDVPANLQTAVRIANRADAPVYAFTASVEPPLDAAGQSDPAIAALRTLAAQTGGDVVIGTNAFETGLVRMVRDFEKHYLLTYRAAHGSDGKFHALVVGVKREGVQGTRPDGIRGTDVGGDASRDDPGVILGSGPCAATKLADPVLGRHLAERTGARHGDADLGAQSATTRRGRATAGLDHRRDGVDT